VSEMTMPAGAAGDAPPANAGATAGAVLREAREAEGMSIDAVAQQLKLHPRQVQALEDGRYDLLPGRTFVRGFLRNYARTLHLDPDRLLAMLPDAAPESLGPTAHNMGEIQFESAPRRSWSRWAIPLALVALIALAAVYEFMRPPAESRRGSETPAVPIGRQDAGAPGPVPATGSTPATAGGTPLPNPLTATPAEPVRAVEPPAPAAGTTGTAEAPPPSPPATPAAASAVGGQVVSTAIPPGTPGEPTLVIVFGGRSWAEVRDAKGKMLLSLTGSPGMTQSVTGTPPFDVVIGSVSDVSLQFRGAPVDLSSYRRANVARLRLD
jgi:cytoskeleton protein RodZ